MRFRTEFAEGQYVQYDATRISKQVNLILALDMVSRGLSGIELTGLDGTVDLTKGLLADLLNELTFTVCVGAAVQLGECIRDHDVICTISNSASFIKCVGDNAETTRLVKQVVSKLWGPRMQNWLLRLVRKRSFR